jgi:protease II
MIWIKDDNPRRLYYQILSSDSTVIESDGVLLLSPMNLLYNTTSTTNPKIIWNGSEYAIFFRSSHNSSRYSLVLLDENNQKLGNENNLYLSDSPRDFFWNGNEYIFVTNNNNELYVRRISWDGKIMNNNLLSDGNRHIHYPGTTFIDKNNYSFFWLDNRDGEYKLYSSDMKCR